MGWGRQGQCRLRLDRVASGIIQAMANTFLDVPFKEKDEAKALGARWDGGAKKWYVPDGKDLALFAA